MKLCFFFLKRDNTRVLSLQGALLFNVGHVVVQVMYLSAVGGDSFNECVRLIIRRLFRREVALQFSYMGRQGKRQFNKLKVCKVVYCEHLNVLRVRVNYTVCLLNVYILIIFIIHGYRLSFQL